MTLMFFPESTILPCNCDKSLLDDKDYDHNLTGDLRIKKKKINRER